MTMQLMKANTSNWYIFFELWRNQMDSLLFTTYDQNKINELQDKLNKLDIPIKVMGLAEVDYALKNLILKPHF